MLSPSKTLAQVRKTLASTHASNAAWSFADVAVYPVVMVFAIPFFMTRLGDEAYGIWQFVNSLIASLGLINIGFGDATVKYVSQYRAEHKPAAVAGVVNATLSAYVALAAVLVVLACLGAEAVSRLNYHHLFKISDANKEVTIRAFQIGSLTFALRLVEHIILSALKGLHRYDAASRLSIASKLCILALNIGMVWAGFGLVAIFRNSAIVTVIGLGVEFYWLRRLVPGTQLWPRFANPYLKQVSGYGFWSWVGAMIGVMGGQLDKLLVTTLAGVQVYAYYSNASFVGERGLAVLASAAGFLFPVVSARLSRGEPLYKMYVKAQMVIVAVGMTIAGVAILVQAPVFTLLWKSKYALSAPYLRGFITYLGVMSATVVPYFYLMGSGMIARMTAMRAVSLAIQFALMPAVFALAGPVWLPQALVTAYLLASLVHNTLIARQILKVDALPFVARQFALPALFLAMHLPNVFWLDVAFFPLAALLWKRIYFDEVAHLFR